MDLFPLIPIALGLSAVMAVAWIVQRTTGRSGWIDVIWTLGVGGAGVAAAWAATGDEARRFACGALIAVWALRLGRHIAARAGHADDPRYAALMRDWGASAPWRLFLFLQVQAAAALALALAVMAAASNPAPFPTVFDLAALALALGAVAGEAVADAQLARFRRSPEAATGVCETGLWRYSRHPNYFFEWLFWCGWPLLAAPYGLGVLLALPTSALMYWLLVHVSGAPPLEAHMLRTRGEAFRDLQRRVNLFFPGPRKKGASR